jgi:hypothetical protein
MSRTSDRGNRLTLEVVFIFQCLSQAFLFYFWALLKTGSIPGMKNSGPVLGKMP